MEARTGASKVNQTARNAWPRPGTGPPRSGARAGGSRCPQGGFLRLVGSSVEVVMPLCVAGVPLPIVWRRCALTVRPERQGPRAAGLPLDKLT